MTKFAYAGVTEDGVEVKGTKSGSSVSEVQLALFDQGYRDLRVTEKQSVLQIDVLGSSIKRDDVMHLSRQMAAFLNAGLPILDAVHTIGAETASAPVRRMMVQIEEGLRTGERFADCLDDFPKVFPPFYRGIVRSAELTGELDLVLKRLALYLERDLEARRKIKAASIYPAVIAVMSLVTVLVLAIYVLPKFKDFFKSLNATLPLPTRMLLGFTDFISAWWPALVGGIVALVALYILIGRIERTRYYRDKFWLGVPVVGDTIQFALVERFCRVLASMVSAGVNLPDSLKVATDSLRNLVYTRGLDGVAEAMLEGQGLATPLARTKLFPGTATQMLRVGEETGSLDAQLEVTAEYYEVELDYKIKRLTSLFEPAVIIFMGLIVGFVAIALVSAMYGIFHQVKV